MRRVLSLTQDESLRERERRTTSRIPLVTTYNPRTSYTTEVANRNWHLLQSKERLAHIFRERPIISYRRSKSLRDILVSAKLTSRTPEGHTTTMGHGGPCNKPKCSCRGTQRECSSKPLKHRIVKRILVFKRQIQAYFYIFICSDFSAESLVIQKLQASKLNFSKISARKKAPENSR